MASQPITNLGQGTNSNRPEMPPDTAARGYTRTATEVDAYLTSKLCPPQWAGNPILERCKQRADDAGIPAIEVSPLQGQHLAVTALGIKAAKILEIGTLWGYSTYFLTTALPSHGQIDTLEMEDRHAKIAKENFLDLDLYPFPKVHVGPALDTLQDPQGEFKHPPGTEEGFPEAERGYDLVFIDANKEQSLEYFLEALRLTRKGGTIIVDNTIRGGRIVLAESDNPAVDVKGVRALYDWLEKDAGKQVIATGIQTVGSKHWDGFVQAVKL